MKETHLVSKSPAGQPEGGGEEGREGETGGGRKGWGSTVSCELIESSGPGARREALLT